ncbi:GntR family transcriptional regulator [Ferdinandcohnia sp. Marseille-Q9671]
MRAEQKGSLPLYRQIADYIRQKVDDGEWPVGYQIPTEQKLCAQFNVSRITVVKALERLVEEGLLIREQGKGTFVSLPELSYETMELLSFTEEMKRKGKKPSSLLLSKRWMNPSKNIQSKLQLKRSDKVWCFRRLMLADNIPLGIQTSYFPMQKFPELMNHVVDNTSLYQILQEKYEVIVSQALETYRAVQLDEEEKELLKVDLGETGFCVERLSYSQDEPIEFVHSIMRADQTFYTVKLVRKGF